MSGALPADEAIRGPARPSIAVRPRPVAQADPDRVKTRTPGRQFMNFSRFSAFSAITGSAERKKFAPDAPFSDNFRVFAQSGAKPDKHRVGLWVIGSSDHRRAPRSKCTVMITISSPSGRCTTRRTRAPYSAIAFIGSRPVGVAWIRLDPIR